MLSVFIICSIIILDQLTKHIMGGWLAPDNSVSIIENFLYFSYNENKGAALGMYQEGTKILIIITAVIMAGLVYYLVKLRKTSRFGYIALSLVLGGAAGNFIDRVRLGHVVDFIDVKLGSFNYPVFNVADSFVVIGTFMLAYYLLFMATDGAEKTGSLREN